MLEGSTRCFHIPDLSHLSEDHITVCVPIREKNPFIKQSIITRYCVSHDNDKKDTALILGAAHDSITWH